MVESEKVSPVASYSSEQLSTDFSIHLIQIILRSVYLLCCLFSSVNCWLCFRAALKPSRQSCLFFFAQSSPDMDPAATVC